MTRKQKTVSKIIEIKEFTKERIEAEVRKARERLDSEQKKLDALEADERRTSADFAKKLTKGSMPLHEVELFTNYLKHVVKQIDHQKAAVARRAAEVDALQDAMIEAHKEQRVFEKLQDRLEHEQLRQAAHGEQKEADFGFLIRKAGR